MDIDYQCDAAFIWGEHYAKSAQEPHSVIVGHPMVPFLFIRPSFKSDLIYLEPVTKHCNPDERGSVYSRCLVFCLMSV